MSTTDTTSYRNTQPTTMTEETDSARSKESVSHMKQWLLAKFQLSSFGSDSEASCAEKETSLPKIVISRGSDKSLHRSPSSPFMRRPSPLTKTWSNHSDTSSGWSGHATPEPHSSRQLSSLRNMLRYNSLRKPKAESLPTTPFYSDTLANSERPRTADGAISSSSVFRFSTKQRRLVDLDYAHSTNSPCYSIDLRAKPVCGACGQNIPSDISAACSQNIPSNYSSQEFEQFKPEASPQVSKQTLKQKALDHSFSNHLDLRRSSSCKIPDSQAHKRISNLSKAKSNYDLQQKTEMSRLRTVKRSSSKKRSRSLISLTRAWSLNLESLKLVRTNTPTRATDEHRKMSLNDTELHRLNDRRRSSLLRFCIEQGSMDETDTIEGTQTRKSSSEGLPEYSPKVTRTAVFKHSKGTINHMESFRSTFDSGDVNVPSVYGQVKVMFQYFTERSVLQLTLLKACNLAGSCRGTLGVYAKICLMPGKALMKVSSDKHDTRDPVFYDVFVFRVKLDKLLESSLRIKFYNKPGLLSRSQAIGECQIPMYYYDLTAVTVIQQNLRKSKGQKDDLDEFDFGPMEQNCNTSEAVSGLLCGLVRTKKVSRDWRP